MVSFAYKNIALSRYCGAGIDLDFNYRNNSLRGMCTMGFRI